MRAAGTRWVIYGDKTPEIKILNFSDIHLMAKACAEKEVRATVEEIADDPACFWTGGGDYAEFIGYTDAKRFDPDAVSDWVQVSDLGRLGQVAFDAVFKLLAPIRHKCLGLIEGNHERKFQQANQQQHLFHQFCCRMADERHEDVFQSRLDLSYSAVFDLIFQKRSHIDAPQLQWQAPRYKRDQWNVRKRVFIHHGAGAAQTKGGKINRLVSFMRNFDADIYLLGHVHDDLGARITPLCADADCTHLEHRDKIGVVSGSYLKTYAQDVTSYGEQKGYEPVSLGAAWVKIDLQTGRIQGRI